MMFISKGSTFLNEEKLLLKETNTSVEGIVLISYDESIFLMKSVFSLILLKHTYMHTHMHTIHTYLMSKL